MKTVLVFFALFGHCVISFSRSDRSTTPKKSDYDSEEDYSDSDDEIPIPKTSFTCDDKKDGFYADIENGCKSFHYCQTFVFPDDDSERKDWIFICPPPTIFRQQYLTCTKPHKSFRCEDSENYFDVNEELPPVPPGDKPTLPPPESDTTDPPLDEGTPTPPPSTKPTTTQSPEDSSSEDTPETPDDPDSETPDDPDSETPDDPDSETPDSSEPNKPDNSEPDFDEDKKKKPAKKPDGFLLPPFGYPFTINPYLSAIPSFHSSSFHLSPVENKDSGNIPLNSKPEKPDMKHKVDLTNPLTLDEFLDKTSWENLEKMKGSNKMGGVPIFKAPVFSSFSHSPSIFPLNPFPIVKAGSGPIENKDSGNIPLNSKLDKRPDMKPKVDLTNPLTLDEFLAKTSWENLEKMKGSNKMGGVPIFKAPLVFSSFPHSPSILPSNPFPILKHGSGPIGTNDSGNIPLNSKLEKRPDMKDKVDFLNPLTLEKYLDKTSWENFQNIKGSNRLGGVPTFKAPLEFPSFPHSPSLIPPNPFPILKAGSGPIENKDSGNIPLNSKPEKPDIKPKVDFPNPLTLDEYLDKTSWENFEKMKGSNKLGGVPTFKAPLVFPPFPHNPSLIPPNPFPILKAGSGPKLFNPQDFDDILSRYNGQIAFGNNDENSPLGPR